MQGLYLSIQRVSTISFSTSPMKVTLSDTQIDIWLCTLPDIEDRNAHFLFQLSPEEKSRAERFKFELHRNRFIASHGFMRKVLARYLNIEADKIEYLNGEKGKPCLADSSYYNLNGLQFNLSHTQDLAILAVTKNAALGIDIEYNNRKTDWKGICKRFFTVPEQQALFSLAEEQQEIAFFDLWTRKEAYMKVLGTGLSLSPTEFTLTVLPQQPALIQHHSKKITPLKYVEFATIDLPEQLNNYCATLATTAEIFNCNYFQFT